MRPIITPEEKQMLDKPNPRLTWRERLLMLSIYACAVCFSLFVANRMYALVMWLSK